MYTVGPINYVSPVIAKTFDVIHGNSAFERPNGGGFSIRSRNGAPSRKGRVVIGPMTRASYKGVMPPGKGVPCREAVACDRGGKGLGEGGSWRPHQQLLLLLLLLLLGTIGVRRSGAGFVGHKGDLHGQ